MIQNSRNAQVYNNSMITTSGDGMGVINQDRGYSNKFPIGVCNTLNSQTRAATCTPWFGINNTFYNNAIYSIATTGFVSGMVKDTDILSNNDFFWI